MEIDRLRRYCRISKIDTVHNEIIRELTGNKETINENIEIKHRLWYVHLKGMPAY